MVNATSLLTKIVKKSDDAGTKAIEQANIEGPKEQAKFVAAPLVVEKELDKQEQDIEEFNLLEDLYFPIKEDEKLFSSKTMKALNHNLIDTAELEGLEPDPAATVIKKYKDKDIKNPHSDEENKDFLDNVWKFTLDLGEEFVLSIAEGGVNGLDFAVNLVPLLDKAFAYGDPTYGIYRLQDVKSQDELRASMMHISEKLGGVREKLKAAGKDNNIIADLAGIIFQDAPYAYPIYKVLNNSGVPKPTAAMLGIGIGGAIGFADDESILVNTQFLKTIKTQLDILPETPESALVDNLTQGLEYSGFAWAIPKLVPVFKFLKRNVPKYMTAENLRNAGITTAGGTVIGKSIADTMEANEQVEIPPIDPNKKPGKTLPLIDVSDPKRLEMGMNPVALEKLLGTKAGEVLPSLKKFGSKLFEKKTTSRFLKQAEEGVVGKNWYKQSGENILKYVAGDKKAADQFAQILAIYSPQKQIPHNTQFAIKAWNRFKSGQKIWEGEILEKAKLPKNLNTTQENKFKKDLLAKYGGGARVKGEKFTGVELVDLEDGNLMVVRHGTYENIAERAKDLKAHLLLNENIPWGGRKTSSFYGNIMKEIDPSIKQAATIDLWMNRAGGFVSKELKDGPKYNFIESVVGTVAKKKKWDIDQAQAAIWVSTKARFDTTKSLFSEKALNSGVGVRKGGHVVPAKGKNKEFADLRFNTAMNYKMASQDIEKAAINFADALDDNLAFVSWETVPGSKYTKHLDGLENASSIIKSEYHFKVSKLLTDESGHDIISKKLGILSPGHFEAPGYFKGVSNPSGQTKIATTRIKGAGKDITTMDAPSQELLEKYAALRGIILSQDEIGYHRIIKAGSKKNANSVAIQTGNKFSAEQVKKLGAALDKEFGGGHALISKEKGVLVLNTGELQNIEFQKRLKSLVELAVDNDYTLIYYKNGNLITRGKTDYGKTYSGILGQIRRADIRQLLRDILSKKKNLDKEFSRKYGFDYDEKAFEEIENFIQRR